MRLRAQQQGPQWAGSAGEWSCWEGTVSGLWSQNPHTGERREPHPQHCPLTSRSAHGRRATFLLHDRQSQQRQEFKKNTTEETRKHSAEVSSLLALWWHFQRWPQRAEFVLKVRAIYPINLFSVSKIIKMRDSIRRNSSRVWGCI